MQGDIVAVYNSNGTKIGTYTYDAWGNFTITSSATGLERQIVYEINPFRYRGYYYDVETGWYYLQSRYYNPEWGRFINADGYISTGTGFISYNMYAYCNNNPIVAYDPTGEEPITIWLIIAAAAVIGGIIGGVTAYNEGERGMDLADDVILAASAGVLLASGTIMVVSVVTAASAGLGAVIVGTPVLQSFGISALCYDFVAYFVAPWFGIEMEGVELEPSSPTTPSLKPNNHPASN